MSTTETIRAWSTTAASNATADAAISSSDSQSPDTLDNNVRSIMAAAKKQMNDIGGALTAGGSANALTVTTNQVLESGQLTGGLAIVLKTASTNTSTTVTFAPDGLTAAAIKRADGSALAVGSIQAGMFLILVYNSGTSEWWAANIAPLQLPASALSTVPANIDYQVFTATSTWTKPSNLSANAVTIIEAWGAGGGGSAASTGGGGGGGGYVRKEFLTSSLGAIETVAIGTGGAVTVAGGNTTFGAWLTAYGGGGSGNAAASGGGGGGGETSAGSTSSGSNGAAGGGPQLAALVGGPSSNKGNFGVSGGSGGPGQGGAAAGAGGNGYFGGGGGGGGANGGGAGGAGGDTAYGGGGGGGSGGGGGDGAGGSSKFGGAGGAGSAVAGAAPGGGGGRNAAGARGECRVTTLG